MVLTQELEQEEAQGLLRGAFLFPQCPNGSCEVVLLNPQVELGSEKIGKIETAKIERFSQIGS
jgi:hypothetical protein